MNTTQPRLLVKLERIARTAHLRIGLYGLLVLLSGGLLAFLTVVTLDWLFWFPAAIRCVIAGLFLAGGAIAGYIWVVRPWRAELGVEQIARIVEEHFGQPNDQIRSAVNFLQGADAGSPDLMAHVVAEADDAIDRLDLSDVFKIRPLLTSALVLAMGIGLLGGISATADWWPRIGLYRYILPLSPIEWPRRVQIERPGVLRRTVPIGESVIVRARLLRGMSDDLRAVMHTRDQHGDGGARTMQRDGEFGFVSVIETVSTEMDVWFEVGDDSTQDDPLRLIPVPRPAVRQATARVLPPTYASDAAIRVRSMDDGPVAATVGSTIEIIVESSKPIGQDADGAATAWMRLDDGTELAMQRDPQNAQRLTASLVLSINHRVTIRLIDEDGFASKEGPEYLLVAKPDTPPRVVIEQPGTVTGVTPDGTVPLIVRIQDDFAITHLTLRARRLTGESLVEIPLGRWMQTETSDNRTVARVAYDWNLADLPLTAGDVVVYDVQATDNFADDSTSGQTARSSALRLKIISESEFDDRVRDDVRHLADAIRRILLDEQAIYDETTSMIQASRDHQDRLEGRSSSTAGRLSDRQHRLAQRLSQIGRQSGRIVQRMELNALPSQPNGLNLGQGLDGLVETLDTIAWGPMTEAAVALGDAARRLEDAADIATGEAATEARDHEQEAIDRLIEILRTIDGWGNFRELLATVRGLMDRQEETLRRTRAAGAGMLGRSAESLDDAERQELRTIQRAQERLAAETRQMTRAIARLDDRAEPGSRNTTTTAPNPSVSDAGGAFLRDALRTVKASEIAERMDEAAVALGRNRTAAATLAEESAQAGLRGVLHALQQQEQRELEELHRQMERAVDAVARLFRQQQDLHRATREARSVGSEPSTFVSLARTQHQLQRNTDQLAGELTTTPDTFTPGGYVSNAADAMSRANSALTQAEDAPAAAESHQSDALTSLQDALTELQSAAEQAAEDRLLSSLSSVMSELRAIRDGQKSINDQTQLLVSAYADNGVIGRADNRRSALLAGKEDLLQTGCTELRVMLEVVPVFDFVLESVAHDMGEIRDALSQRRLKRPLLSEQASVVRRLNQLVGVIDEMLSLPPADDFADGQGAGDGSSSSGAQRPVPHLAELMVLRAMQLDLNERTAALDETMVDHQVSEEKLDAARRLGLEQDRLRGLTLRVTQQVRSGSMNR